MAKNQSSGNIAGVVEVGNVLVHLDILTEYFCCDIAKCNGQCCEEGDAGAPVTLDEVAEIENSLDTIWSQLGAQAQSVIDCQGVAYTDIEGELVTSIVNGRNCVFRGPHGCLLPQKPISCHLYPIREKQLGPMVGLNYNRWDICKVATVLGEQKRLRGAPHSADQPGGSGSAPAHGAGRGDHLLRHRQIIHGQRGKAGLCL